MISDVPVGAFLSGGLDSSAIVALARRHRPRLPCFAIDLSGHDLSDEGLTVDLPYARAAAHALEVDLHEIRVGPGITDHLETMVEQLDEPQADPAGLLVGLIANLARRHGIKVLLSGLGADDVFAGYRRHRALQYERAWSSWPRTMRRAVRGASRLLPARGPLRRLRKGLAYVDRSPDARIVSYFFWIDPDRVRALYTPEWVGRLLDWDCSDPLLKTLEGQPSRWSPLSRMLGLERRHFLGDHNLNYTDKMAMASGVEVRVPFLDPDLVALADALPDDLKIHAGQGKWILREAVRDLLPDDILSRSKTGFGAPVRGWLRGPLRPLVDELLGERSLSERGFFRPSAVRALIMDDRRGRIDAAYTLLAMVCIELWCRRFLDRPVV
jgi:asparagine synthase (glutamine-hydrolysing)